MKRRTTRLDRIPLATFADLVWEVPLVVASSPPRQGHVQHRTPWAVQPSNRIVVLQVGARISANRQDPRP